MAFYNHRRPHQALDMKTSRRGIRISGLTCADSAGSIQFRSTPSNGSGRRRSRSQSAVEDIFEANPTFHLPSGLGQGSVLEDFVGRFAANKSSFFNIRR
ncbi:hypothetical protein [Cereibacter sphaeroides]|uniref:hypothetical protein n=1 Tax=Cereibacter sphaeroides TaxID=1063 RepID=UPI003AF0B4DE